MLCKGCCGAASHILDEESRLFLGQERKTVRMKQGKVSGFNGDVIPGIIETQWVTSSEDGHNKNHHWANVKASWCRGVGRGRSLRPHADENTGTCRTMNEMWFEIAQNGLLAVIRLIRKHFDTLPHIIAWHLTKFCDIESEVWQLRCICENKWLLLPMEEPVPSASVGITCPKVLKLPKEATKEGVKNFFTRHGFR